MMSSLSMLFQALVPLLSPWLASQLFFSRPVFCKFRCYQCGNNAGTSLLFLNIVAKCVFPRVNPITTGTTLRASSQSQSWFPLPCIIEDLFLSLGVFYLFKISPMGGNAEARHMPSVKLRWQINSNQRRWPSLFFFFNLPWPKRQSLSTWHGSLWWAYLTTVSLINKYLFLTQFSTMYTIQYANIQYTCRYIHPYIHIDRKKYPYVLAFTVVSKYWI